MPLIVLCGLPASGKSGVASQLEARLQTMGISTLIISEISLGMERNASYKDSISEKRTRGSLKAAVERNLRGDLAVILDSMNAIKGYRYELWCIAKAAKARYCCIHCDVPLETCKAWNETRGNSGYSSDIFADLAGRLEVPDTRNRWDTPLFRLNLHSSQCHEELEAITASVTGRPSAHLRGITRQPLQPTMATQNPELSSTNLLSELDRTAQEIVSKIAEEQSRAGAEAIGNLELDGHKLILDKRVSLPELRKHKRAFLKLATQNGWLKLRTSDNVGKFFVEYLQENI